MGRNSIHDKADAAKRAHAMSRPRWRWPSWKNTLTVFAVVGFLSSGTWLVLYGVSPHTVVPRDETGITHETFSSRRPGGVDSLGARARDRQGFDSRWRCSIHADNRGCFCMDYFTLSLLAEACRSRADSVHLGILYQRVGALIAAGERR